MRARVWSPQLGSFLSVDAFQFHDGISTLWGWPQQSPLALSDPSGHGAHILVGAVVGGVVGGVVYAATAPTSMGWGEFGAGAVQAAAVGAALGAITAANPQLGFFLSTSLFVSNERDLWQIGLWGGGLKPCPVRAAALTAAEREAIQATANEFGTQIDVVGSRASGMGRNIETDLPVGKGPGTRSDIDFRISGEADIQSGGGLSERLQNVGNGAGNIVSNGLPQIPSTPPYIPFSPE
jgi:hypothetical protein